MRTRPGCARCQAPLSEGKTVCGACGEPIRIPPPARAAAGEEAYTRPCPACGQPAPLYRNVCRSCGREPEPWRPPPRAGLPPGFVVRAEPGGPLRMSRTLWGHLNQTGDAVYAMLVTGAGAGYFFHSLARHGFRADALGLWDWVRAALVLLLAAYAGLYLRRRVTVRDTWVADPDRLEIWRAAWGKTRLLLYEDAELVVGRELRPQRNAREAGPWLMRAFLFSRSFAHREGAWVLSVRAGSESTVLQRSGLLGGADLQSLAAALSDRTGWPVRTDGVPGAMLAFPRQRF